MPRHSTNHKASVMAIRLDKNTQAGLNLMVKRNEENGNLFNKSAFIRDGIREYLKQNGISDSDIRAELKKQK